VGSLREKVYEILRRVPHGRVVTYGQLALLAGSPRAARQVGWIAHNGGPDLPWQRVVNRHGGLASGYGGGRLRHRLDLIAEGVAVRPDLTVDLARYQWWPRKGLSSRIEAEDEAGGALTGPRDVRNLPRRPRARGKAARRRLPSVFERRR
jgi:methylated-DNA-protein-cysteine methyltransferase related protein